MSRIGKKTITIPAGVTVEISATEAVVKSGKGTLTITIPRGILVSQEEGVLSVTRKRNSRELRALHGLVRNLIANAVVGVTDGYKKTLKMVGTGYRVQAKGKGLSLAVGYSHPVEVNPTEGIDFAVEGNDTILISGIDKQQVGQVAANIRAVRPPEPYKGKGIRYEDEYVRIKPGKTAAA
ncbi:50S ribosomal protein L6 [Candidatus Woesebacteria bacterium]|nr:50S ribosomal protein L6 [Candidatus Woesebacteria bacterium]